MNMDRRTDKDTDFRNLTDNFLSFIAKKLFLWPQRTSQRTVFLILCPNHGNRDVTDSHNVVHRDMCLYLEAEQLD